MTASSVKKHTFDAGRARSPACRIVMLYLDYLVKPQLNVYLSSSGRELQGIRQEVYQDLQVAAVVPEYLLEKPFVLLVDLFVNRDVFHLGHVVHKHECLVDQVD
jgi:hypothetical protein